MSNVIKFQRYKSCRGLTLNQIRDWLKSHGWRNVKFDTRDLENVIAERLPE